MKSLGLAVLVFLASFVGCWIAASAAALIFGSLAGVSQAEGAYAMGAVFLIGPAAGLVGAVIVTALVIRRGRRKAPVV